MERRRQMMAMQKWSILPKEYQQVEWVKTLSGNEAQNVYVKSGISNSDIKTVICRYGVINFNDNNYSPIFLASYTLSASSAMAPYVAISGRQSGNLVVTPTHQNPVSGITDTYTITYPSGANNYLRIGGWTDINWTAEGAYYFVTVIGTDDTEIAKFIPCYRKSDNIAGFYDIIRNSFYPSDGKRNYIAGPNV